MRSHKHLRTIGRRFNLRRRTALFLAALLLAALLFLIKGAVTGYAPFRAGFPGGQPGVFTPAGASCEWSARPAAGRNRFWPPAA